jgi:hypothetical protein
MPATEAAPRVAMREAFFMVRSFPVGYPSSAPLHEESMALRP